MLPLKRLNVCLSLSMMVLPSVPAFALQLGLRTAEEWIGLLDGEQRVADLRIDEVIARLGLEPGDTVADIGAGSGVFSGPLARAVAPGGTLLAVEIDQELLDHIAARAAEEGDANIRTVLGGFDDPNLPASTVDVAFFHDVLHHVENRELYLRNLAGYLEPDGRIVVIDQIRGHQNDPEMQMSQQDVEGYMAAAGFEVGEEIELFENKYFVVFERGR